MFFFFWYSFEYVKTRTTNIACTFFQVHDFGFFRYDPAAIQFLSYEEIPLAPEAACVGLEIRVVGNDSGEKVFSLYFSFRCKVG